MVFIYGINKNLGEAPGRVSKSVTSKDCMKDKRTVDVQCSYSSHWHSPGVSGRA